MPKKYGVKEKDQVVVYITDQLLSGKLRTGDRVDRNEIAQELGLSRIPVQEAIVQLEHDGILSTEYHRGAFVERFDAETVLEHHQVYGMLSGMASERAATFPSPRILGRLNELMDVLRSATESKVFEETVWEYRRTINHEYAGPRLQAAIRAFQSFIPLAFWTSYADNQAMMLPFYEQEHAAIRRRDPDAAQQACRGRSTTMAGIVINELVARGVFDEADRVTNLQAATTPSHP
ncbi:GntR family transcriptional regulator [Mycolicibacterium sp.]|uniref:GntR family transcriptional regulator n=1 Tax=Mycolicibacterium sp. TaxID=2320850 RepID=UPI001A34EB52|nr:GntR family transcriptional regulator [Mycolicibacterium sp.]MBJ7336766.1 GntR family transcriptional regulator [Mycolicibacterium sp.]